MRDKNYKKQNIIILITLIVITVEIVLLIKTITFKMPTYKKISGIVIKQDLLSVIVSKEDKKLIYQNQKVYLNNKTMIYEIYKDNGLIIKSSKKYYQLFLKIKLRKKYKTGDIIDLTIADRKKTIFKIFKNCWEGG